jgi:putative lipoprotein
MTSRSKKLGASLSLIGWLAACSATSAVPADGGVSMAKVTGTVTYRERVALPPTAAITVQLVDVSRADAPAIMLGEQVTQAAGKQVPFAFEIAFDPAKIEASHSYAVQARIEEDGELRFISDRHYAVITRGAPTRVDMVLRSVGTPGAR